MAKKERSEKKEKPLEKMTAKELRELALTIPNISGVHGMNKEELIATIKEARGITEDKKANATNVRDVKAQIQELKQKKTQAHESGDQKSYDLLRKKISRLKKRTRRAA